MDRLRHFARGLSDNIVLLLALTPLSAILIDQFAGAHFEGLYPFAILLTTLPIFSLYKRLKFKEVKFQASKRRIKKLNQLGQSFVFRQLSEIRRPLQGLIGVRDIYDFNFEDPEINEYMDLVNHCSEHVLRHINRLQLYSDIKSETIEPKDVRFSLSHILQDSYKEAEANNPGKKVQLDKHISPEVMRDYFGPYGLLRSLISEVIDNSIRFSPRAEIVLSAKASDRENQNLVVSIKDRGPGLTKAKIHELQSELAIKAGSRDFLSDGKGLGIPLIKSLVKQLDAELSVKSEKGEGTVFEIHIRVPAYTSQKKASNEVSAGKVCEILIVDDDPLSQKIVSAMLTRLGYRSTIVSNGHDAAELCRKQKFGFILMDLEMPIMDGWEATKHIMANHPEGIEKPHIVALTAKNSLQDKERATEAGCANFVTKPISRGQLASALSNAGALPHFRPQVGIKSISSDAPTYISSQTVDFKKVLEHYKGDTSLCQMIIIEAIASFPDLLEELDKFVMNRDMLAVKKCLHKLAGEFASLLCITGKDLAARLESHESLDSLDFISGLEELNRYCDSLLNELSMLAKHNEIRV